MVIFKQISFLSGLNRELDEAKAPDDSYPVLVNGRVRTNVIKPTKKHKKLAGPDGNYQSLYANGRFLLLFVSGKAYYADITQSPSINFLPVPNFIQFNDNVPRIYAELVSYQSNKFNRTGTPNTTELIFNGSIGSFPQAIFCWDGTDARPQAILPNPTAVVLGDYNSWTTTNPEYVPSGCLPAIQGNKLFLVSTDRQRIYSSVSGRFRDFVINITPTGDKAGDAETTAIAPTYNEITSLRPVNSGQLLVSTLQATYAVTLDYTNLIFAEPYLVPVPLYAAGAINELSFVDLNGDTTFITQSGIQSFNAVAQMLRESNNTPFGSKIRGLLNNPQVDTCAVYYDDYALYAMSSIYGYGAFVYDVTREQFASLDLSFGRVKMFANTRIAGAEQLFYITHDNEIYQAFASDEVNSTRVYFGDWTPNTVDQNFLVDMVDIAFAHVRTSGQVKLTLVTNHRQVGSVVINVDVEGYSNEAPISIPFQDVDNVRTVGWQFSNKQRGWRFGVLVEWNFEGDLTDVTVEGSIYASDNPEFNVQSLNNDAESFAFIADSGYSDELNPGNFNTAGFVNVQLVQGASYYFYPAGQGPLVCGDTIITEGLFVAKGPQCAVKGPASSTCLFSLKTATNFVSVLNAICALPTLPTAIIGGGDHTYGAGTYADCEMGINPIDQVPFYPVAGNHDIDTLLGKFFYAKVEKPRYYSKRFGLTEFFFYDGGWTSANVGVNAQGITNGPTSTPDGNDIDSTQWANTALAVQQSTALYKFLVVHEPPKTTDNAYYPGYAVLDALPFKTIGLSAVLSGHAHSMERWDSNGFPLFVCGTGGASLRAFRGGTEGLSEFRDATHFGYLHIEADHLVCKLTFKDTNNAVLDEYSIYAT